MWKHALFPLDIKNYISYLSNLGCSYQLVATQISFPRFVEKIITTDARFASTTLEFAKGFCWRRIEKKFFLHIHALTLRIRFIRVGVLFWVCDEQNTVEFLCEVWFVVYLWEKSRVIYIRIAFFHPPLRMDYLLLCSRWADIISKSGLSIFLSLSAFFEDFW